MIEVHTVYFDGTGRTRTDFKRLRDVFIHSFRAHMPDARLHVHNIPPCALGRQYKLASNTYKLTKWAEIAEKATGPTVICDCDLMFDGRIDDAFDYDFDLAYAQRYGRFPFNCGVIFLRPTETAREVMRQWKAINDKMFADATFHLRYTDKYAGMNQAAWGYMRETGKLPETVIQVPHKYNACEDEWLRVEDIRVYHLKTTLRQACLIPPDQLRRKDLRPIVEKFHAWEAQGEINFRGVPTA
ncbi:MAG: hypothetical protein CMK32_09950 [Porticoccaceae bacterium]|nr:hypothetical protein [Porticoccaceae bacterium]